VDAADLNSLVDAGTALKGIVMDQPSATPVPADDSLLFHDLSADNLARCKISALGAGTVSSVSMTVAPTTIYSVAGTPVTTAGTLAFTMKPQLANTVLAGPTTGSGIPAFRVLAPTDIPTTTVTIAAAAINWDLGGTFMKTLTGNIVFTFTNANAGQTIRVLVLQDASHTVTWPGTVRWPGGTVPIMTTGGGRVDIYTFHFIGGVYYGTFNQNFL
jgi:hypothetical protein